MNHSSNKSGGTSLASNRRTINQERQNQIDVNAHEGSRHARTADDGRTGGNRSTAANENPNSLRSLLQAGADMQRERSQHMQHHSQSLLTAPMLLSTQSPSQLPFWLPVPSSSARASAGSQQQHHQQQQQQQQQQLQSATDGMASLLPPISSGLTTPLPSFSPIFMSQTQARPGTAHDNTIHPNSNAPYTRAHERASMAGGHRDSGCGDNETINPSSDRSSLPQLITTIIDETLELTRDFDINDLFGPTSTSTSLSSTEAAPMVEEGEEVSEASEVSGSPEASERSRPRRSSRPWLLPVPRLKRRRRDDDSDNEGGRPFNLSPQ